MAFLNLSGFFWRARPGREASELDGRRLHCRSGAINLTGAWRGIYGRLDVSYCSPPATGAVILSRLRTTASAECMKDAVEQNRSKKNVLHNKGAGMNNEQNTKMSFFNYGVQKNPAKT